MLVPHVAPRRVFSGASATNRAAASMLMSRLAAEVSHDMRVPLSSIIASLEMLEEEIGDHPDPAVLALLARTQKAADRMLRMLVQHMEINPASVGQLPSDVDLGQVAKQLAVDSARLLELADATLDIGFLPVVRADPDEMYSVLQNLLNNALKFGRPGVRPWVSISASRVPGAWRVSVTDNGIGIPEDRRVDVFSLFTRVSTRVEGHGIGLSTVARTVNAVGGRVGADEAPGGGAEVWFELPASPDAQKHTTPRQAERARRVAEPTPPVNGRPAHSVDPDESGHAPS